MLSFFKKKESDLPHQKSASETPLASAIDQSEPAEFSPKRRREENDNEQSPKRGRVVIDENKQNYQEPCQNTLNGATAEISHDQKRKKTVWDAYFMSCASKQPCPACGKLISIEENNFEIQQVIPRGCGAPSDSWNAFPLCSNVPEEDEDGDEASENPHKGWGCSELLDRLCIEAEFADSDNSNALSLSTHAIDWMVLNHPKGVHEFLIRMQRAHGDIFGLPVGDSLCLRFARDVYQFGQNYSENGCNHAEKKVLPAGWLRCANGGFKVDLVDLVECMSYSTDRDVLKKIELKDMLTPKKSVKNGLRTPARVETTPRSTRKVNPIVLSEIKRKLSPQREYLSPETMTRKELIFAPTSNSKSNQS